MAGVSRQAVSAVESDISDPSLRVALALASALGMTVEELFGSDGDVMPVAATPAAGQINTREVQGLLKVLSSAWLLDQLASLPGYDPGRYGDQIATLPLRH